MVLRVLLFPRNLYPSLYRDIIKVARSIVRLSLTWNRYASPKAVERQKMKSRFGCSGMA